jgi:PTH1 family peptidyl-tRNA hydrolase
MDQSVKYVVGLGNPGSRYHRTRHNVGWLVLDEVAAQVGTVREAERPADFTGLLRRPCSPYGECQAARRAAGLVMVRPISFMNESGLAVARLLQETGAGLEELLVVADDIYLELGALRLRRAGSAGGHRGLQSIIDRIGTDQFPRLKVGIGPCAPGIDARAFVLSPFEEPELALVERMVRRAAEAVLCWRSEGVETAMCRYNGKVE